MSNVGSKVPRIPAPAKMAQRFTISPPTSTVSGLKLLAKAMLAKQHGQFAT
jgi:hypothetical protein